MKLFLSTSLLFLWIQFGFGQTTWYQVQTGVNNQLNCIEFASENVGYIGGNDTLLLKSVDGGMTWTQIIPSGLNVFVGGEHILDLKFFSETIGYMVLGPYGGTYKTIDGGLIWNIVTVSGNLCFQEALYFFNENNGFIGGAGCFEGELIDLYDGANINQATMNDNGLGGGEAIVDIDFRNANFGLAASSGSRIFRTIDGGQNWDSISLALLGGAPVTSVEIINDTLAYAGYENIGSSAGLLISTDAGLTWSMDPNSATFYYPSFFDIIETSLNRIYVGCEIGFPSLGLIFENQGPFWATFTVEQPIYDMNFYLDSVVWGVGDSGYVVVNVPPLTLGFDNSQSEAEVIKVFPNPTSRLLTIQSTANLLSSRVYSLTGQQELILDDNTSQIDVSQLANGVYVLQMKYADKVESIRFVKE